ncbi:MAG: hypothetical protein JXR82_05810 [Marinifilaceae bacterium]|nr:hypothetical protein [Marinifilaceae bacterium]
MRKLILLILLVGLGVYGQAQTLKGYTIGDNEADTKLKVLETTVGGVRGTIMVGFKGGKINIVTYKSVKVSKQVALDLFKTITDYYELDFKKSGGGSRTATRVAVKGDVAYTVMIYSFMDCNMYDVMLILNDISDKPKSERKEILHDF